MLTFSGVQDNDYWVNRLRRAYQSRNFTGDLASPLHVRIIQLYFQLLLVCWEAKQRTTPQCVWITREEVVIIRLIFFSFTWLQAQDELREEVRAETNTESMKESLCRILPLPCTSDYKAIVLLPNGS